MTVRMYLKRAQFEYRYRVCGECVRVLKSLLWTAAENVQTFAFEHADPRGGLPRVQA